MERTILAGATLIDGSGTPPVAGRAVVVEQGRIAAVVGEREAPPGRVVRLDGPVRAGLVPGPRILCAGRGICITGGHGWHLIGREADGPDEVRKGVREQIKAGADVIKIFATGGVMTPGVDPNSAQLTLDEVRAAIEEARKAGRRTAAHAGGAEGIANALEGGITTIEHGIFLNEALCRRMARDGVAWCRHSSRRRRS